MLLIAPYALQSASLTWTGAESSEWNTVHQNWDGADTFQSGDHVSFAAGGRIFIGRDGVAEPVSPASVTIHGGVTFSGGDILSGSFFYEGGPGVLIFSNYTTSLSFPGDLRLRNGASVLYDIRSAPNNASLHLGSGNIIFEDGSLSVVVSTGKLATLTNPLIVTNTATLRLHDYGPHTNGPIRFGGDIHLHNRLNIESRGTNQFMPDQLAGALRIKFRSGGVSLFFNGSYGHRALELSGPIITDFTPTVAGTTLQLQNYGLFGVRITNPSNTFSTGTLILSSPSAPKAAIEVAPQSSLGTGNVEVQGLLRFMGSRNMGTNALLVIRTGGQVHLDPGVVLRLRALRLENNFYTSGVFNSNTAPGWITGPGEIRLPHYNVRPTIQPTDPPNRTVYAGTDVPFHVNVNDPDGRITKVVYAFYEAVLIHEVTAPPWTFVFSNAPPWNIWYSFATAYDDEGAFTTAGLYDVRTIEPPAPLLRQPRLVDSNAFAFDFDALAGVKYSVEAWPSNAAPRWHQMYQTLPVLSAPATITITNALPGPTNSQLFRIRAGFQPRSVPH